MTSIATAIIGSAVVGGVIADRSASKQAKALKKGKNASIREQARQYDQTREDLAPWREAGQNSLDMLADPNANFQASPDYEFRRDEGLRGLGNVYGVKGGGGNAMKALNEWNSNIASNEFGNWWQRNFNMAEAGRGATNSTAQAGQNAANMNSQTYMNHANNMAQVASDKYAAINSAAQSAISNGLYAWGGPSSGQISEIPTSAYAPKQRTY